MVVSCLLESSVTFEPVGNVTNVFFDDKNQQVFSVRSGGATGILVRGFSDHLCSTFRLEDRGSIISIKLSPDQSILAVQRQKSSVHFIPVISRGANGVLDDSNEFVQNCRSKNTNILGFYWTNSSEVVFLTSHGVEVYSLLQEKRALKYLRCITHQINWFAFCVQSALLVASSSAATTTLQPFLVKPNSQILKLSKIEFDRQEIREKNVQLVTLYSNLMYIVVILHPTAETETTTDIHLFHVAKEGSSVTKTHILKAPFVGGGLALNVVDNVILVHHRSAGKTVLFDVALNAESDGMVTYHNQPVLHPLQVVPSKSSIASLRRSGSVNVNLGTNPESDVGYSRNWVTFMPDVIIDAKEGIMWKIKLRLNGESSKQLISDLPRLVGFLQQRDGAKLVLLDVLLEWCLDPTTDLPSIGAAFNLICHEYRQYLDAQMMSNMALPVTSFLSATNFSSPVTSPVGIRSPLQSLPLSPLPPSPLAQTQIPAQVILDEADLYTNLFSPMVDDALSSEEDSHRKTKRLLSIVMEYLRSLEERQIPIQHFLNELLINLLVRQRSFFLLHQLLQYHVISDSKPLACLLLSLENVYPASYQLALDMLVRLKNSAEEICEILLSKGFVLSALRYAIKTGIENTVPAQKFLEASKNNSEDFFTTYTFLKERNLLPRNCQEYNHHFKTIFGGHTSDD